MNDKPANNKPANNKPANTLPQQKSSSKAIAEFLDRVNTLPVQTSNQSGKLIFALDATASRQPTWNTARAIQTEMFNSTKTLGGIATQLCYFRGFSEFQSSGWISNTQTLANTMQTVECLGGHTQIARLLQYCIDLTRNTKINAIVFVGDAVEEAADTLCNLAGKLGILGVPVFIFHEGDDGTAATVFKQIAKLSNGAYCPFNQASAHLLAELLGAVAVYAAGGKQALLKHQRVAPAAVKLLTDQIGK